MKITSGKNLVRNNKDVEIFIVQVINAPMEKRKGRSSKTLLAIFLNVIQPLTQGKMCPQNPFFGFHLAGMGFFEEKTEK